MFAPILVPVSSVSGVDGENDNVIDLDDAPIPSAKHTRIPAGTILFTAFHCGHPSEPDIHGVREYEGHPDEVRLRGQLLRITLGKKRLTLREQRLVHRMLVPVMNTGQATSEEKVVMALMAIGYNRSHILGLFLGESAVIGLAGGLVGLLAGMVMVSLLHAVGVTFVIPLNNYPIIIRPFFTMSFAASVVATGVLAAILASLYPAFQASRMKPLEALSHN